MKIKTYIQALIQCSPALALAVFFSCANPPEYPREPIIEFVSISKDTIRRPSTDNVIKFNQPIFVDTTLITIDFTDGDGDIGDRANENGVAELRLFYIDSRNGAVSQLQIPFVNEAGASSGIKGSITFRFIPTCCISELLIDPCNSFNPDFLYDEFTLDVYIEDRAGNVSNTVTTAPLYIKCFPE